nr:putative integron gene cassette protein [uncultured bacterium]
MELIQTNDETLSRLGENVASLILGKKYTELAKHYGHALAFGKEPDKAIESELQSCLSEAGENSKLSLVKKPTIEVKYFNENESNLLAAVECRIMLENQPGQVLLELIVSGSNTRNNVMLEQISFIA